MLPELRESLLEYFVEDNNKRWKDKRVVSIEIIFITNGMFY